MVWTTRKIGTDELVGMLTEHIDNLDGESLAELGTEVFNSNFTYEGEGVFEEGFNDDDGPI